MAFLDNSGDIILDAVLTDTGRFRLAKGDGSFKIVKFALGDDEINYATYDKNNPSGSAYYDLAILQTPILEAFTNNTSLMNSKLISIPRTNLLYLPVLKLSGQGNTQTSTVGGGFSGNFEICVNQQTVGETTTNGFEGLIYPQLSTATKNTTAIVGRLNGFNTSDSANNYIRVDQGLDTTEISSDYTIDADLMETQYIIEIDNRFGSIASVNGTLSNVSFIDDDNIASYYFSLGTENPPMVASVETGTSNSTIEGPRGTKIEFKIQASTDLATSNYLFTQLGSTDTVAVAAAGGTPMDIYYIDSIIKVTGATTGYRIDIPVRFVKKQ